MEEYDIVAHYRFHRDTIQIFVQTMAGETITLDVEAKELVEELKGQLEVIVWVPPGRQRLIFEGEVLEDDKRLSDYNIKSESILSLTVVDMETLSITVTATNGAHIFDSVKAGYILDTTDGTVVKNEIWKLTGMITICTDEGVMQVVFGKTDIDTIGKCKRIDDELLAHHRAEDPDNVFYWVRKHELKLRKK